MAELDTLDILVLGVILIGTTAYFTKGTLWGVTKDPYASSFAANAGNKAGRSRNFVEKMDETDKNCIIFYGSQTGTAEDYASRLAKEGKSRFGLNTMVADLEDYDFENLDEVPSDKLVMFILATYGEGEPTDNAVEFYEFIRSDDVNFSNGTSLDNLNYVAFGLGNNTYEHYNSMVRNVDTSLTTLGAHRIGAAGEGDDGAGTMEEDFLAWKDPMWAALAEKMGLEEREAVYEPTFAIVDRDTLTIQSEEVYLGEPNKAHLQGTPKGPFNAQNPFAATIAESRELFNSKDRSCIHMEVDISGSNLSYQTGDHIAVWPSNAGEQVDLFLSILGLTEKRNDVISIKALEPTAKVPFPTPTTYDAIVRYHLEICAPVSRQMVSTLSAFAPTDAIKAEMARLGNDKDYFHEKTEHNLYNIAQFLSAISKGEKWTSIPFSSFIESLTKLQPRYYSISSSSLVQPKKVSITAVVETQALPNQDPFRGVATHYIAALFNKQNQVVKSDPYDLTYQIEGPRGRYNGTHMPVHIRHSNFKLPSDPSRPVIMIGPGTGVAPFRAFVQERAKQAEDGAEVGKTLLFFGSRNAKEDYLYESEWAKYKETLGDKFEIITPSPEQSTQVNELLKKKALFYVCGDAARMAREVNATLAQIIADGRGITAAKAEEVVKSMRAANQYQEDVWS
ncbi:hypothetical protein NQ176_g3118 [Zarea fungicola]|uniref:Uncharacterized protein n=1 Tax=Zarea fungicola TaxID=93591 RepID=A0ACC1NL75_9HYPO|nr:hypothetical protein NQ176_g3118 [Lecanicillium fungicola]